METADNSCQQSSTNENHKLCPWRLINDGLNIEGLCKNPVCRAHNQMVVINLGFGEFDFARIVLQRRNQCPLCKNTIEPIRYALHNCRWWYVNHYSTNSYPLNKVINTYQPKRLTCEYIIMEIMPLDKEDREHTEIEDAVCAICLGDIEDGLENIRLPCSHQFHRACIYKWLTSSQNMAHTCPICVFDANCYLTQNVLFGYFTSDVLSCPSSDLFVNFTVISFHDLLNDIHSNDENEELNFHRRLWPSSEGYNNVFVSDNKSYDYYSARFRKHLFLEKILGKPTSININRTIEMICEQSNRFIDMHIETFDNV